MNLDVHFALAWGTFANNHATYTVAIAPGPGRRISTTYCQSARAPPQKRYHSMFFIAFRDVRRRRGTACMRVFLGPPRPPNCNAELSSGVTALVSIVWWRTLKTALCFPATWCHTLSSFLHHSLTSQHADSSNARSGLHLVSSSVVRECLHGCFSASRSFIGRHAISPTPHSQKLVGMFISCVCATSNIAKRSKPVSPGEFCLCSHFLDATGPPI